MNIKVIVATHKQYWMPSDSVYLPIHVGAVGKSNIGYQRDDEGDNISEKNENYCELTGLYWAWKNLNDDYIGLAHYRRHYSNGKRFGGKKDKVIKREELEKLLMENDIILPMPRNYWVETNYNQYVHAHHAVDLDKTREILVERYPEYTNAWDSTMKRRKGHRFNMFIMKRDKFDLYCDWLFDILFELEKRLDISTYNKNDKRVFGFVSERLLDVWIETKQFAYKDIKYVFMEKQNWLIKGGSFLIRKLCGKNTITKNT